MALEFNPYYLALKETDYCYVLAQAWHGDENDGICLERIFTKLRCEEEIRLAWWNNRNQAQRPADLDAANWVDLFSQAIRENVFSADGAIGLATQLIFFYVADQESGKFGNTRIHREWAVAALWAALEKRIRE